MGFFDKLKKGLNKTRENLTNKIEKIIIGYADIDDDLLDELEETLIMADVGVQTTDKLMTAVRKGIKQKEINTPEDLKPFLQKQIVEILTKGEELDTTRVAANGPTVLLVIGVNGAGKTTTIGKLASRLKKEGKSVILGAADTFRAAAIEQLEVWAERADVPIIKHAEGADPAAVVYDTISAAKARHADVVICDTAGRLHNKKNLMDELSKISRIIDKGLPGCSKEVLLVLDATTGQNAVNQAREFKEAAGLTGIVLTKLDGTAKGGVVLAIHRDLGLPVKFIGVGEQVDDLQPFDAEDFARALFERRPEA